MDSITFADRVKSIEKTFVPFVMRRKSPFEYEWSHSYHSLKLRPGEYDDVNLIIEYHWDFIGKEPMRIDWLRSESEFFIISHSSSEKEILDGLFACCISRSIRFKEDNGTNFDFTDNDDHPYILLADISQRSRTLQKLSQNKLYEAYCKEFPKRRHPILWKLQVKYPLFTVYDNYYMEKETSETNITDVFKKLSEFQTKKYILHFFTGFLLGFSIRKILHWVMSYRDFVNQEETIF